MMRNGILFILLLLLCSSVSAAVDQVRVLDTTGYYPDGLWMFTFAAGIATLLYSYRYKDELAGGISVALCFIAMLESRHIDYTSGISFNSTTPTVIHTIYQPNLISILAGILFIIGIINEYLIWVLSKKPTVADMGDGNKQQQ